MPPPDITVIEVGDITNVKDNVKEFFRRTEAEFAWKLSEETPWTHVKTTGRGYVISKLPLEEQKKRGIDSKAMAVRIEATFRGDLKKTIDALTEYEIKQTWDATMAPGSSSEVENVFLEDGKLVYGILRSLTKPALAGLVSAREYVDLGLIKFLPDGCAQGVGASVDYKGLPVKKKLIRAFNYACGFDIRTLEDGQLKLTYMLHPEVGGWVPVGVVHKASIDAINEIAEGLIDFVTASAT